MYPLRFVSERLPDLSRTGRRDGFSTRANLSDDSGGARAPAARREFRPAHRSMPRLSGLRNSMPVGRGVWAPGGGRAGTDRKELPASAARENTAQAFLQ